MGGFTLQSHHGKVWRNSFGVPFYHNQADCFPGHDGALDPGHECFLQPLQQKKYSTIGVARPSAVLG